MIQSPKVKDSKFKTREELLSMDEEEFRARFRERCHHTMEIQVYTAAYDHKTLPQEQTKTAELFISVWQERGLSTDLPEYQYVMQLLTFAEQLKQGKTVDLSQFQWHILTPNEQKIFDQVIFERRSVRHWKEQRVPDELIEKILKAGLWAAHACNLQSIRYLVVREETNPGLFRGSDIPGGPVHIVVLQDMRTYRANTAMPDSNQLLDAGAAAQNMVLAAHAYGLSSCWLTFTSDKMKQRIAEHVNLPDYMRMTTYIDVGYPDQTPCPPMRRSVADSIFANI